MMNKPSKNSFLTFGSIYNQPISPSEQQLVCARQLAREKTITKLFCFSQEVYIELVHGLASILIGNTPILSELSVFPIHNHLKIKPNIYFNIVPVSNEVTYNLIAPKVCMVPTELAVPYTYLPLHAPFQVSDILDCYQTDVTQFHFHTSSHNYYELLYVSEGSLNVSIDKHSFTLSAHDLILCAPNDPLRARQITIHEACSYMTMVFDLRGQMPPHILHHIFRCSNELKDILWKISKQAACDSYYAQMLMPCHLQETLVRVLMHADETRKRRVLTGTQGEVHSDLLQQILAYMNTHVTEPITVEEICHEFFISRSSLQMLFKMYLHSSPKSYLLNSKLEKSKELIRESQHTISEIAYLLGFSSIHYFSRLFKKYFQISPSEYAKQAADETSNAAARGEAEDTQFPPSL